MGTGTCRVNYCSRKTLRRFSFTWNTYNVPRQYLIDFMRFLSKLSSVVALRFQPF